MIPLRRPGLLLLHALLLGLLFVMLPGAGEARAAENCRADQLRGATVKASAKFDHRGRDTSMLTSVMDIRIPAGWEPAPALLLDAHSHDYRFALRCLLGKVTEKSFFDQDEWRLKPLTVAADGKTVTVHYEAVVWVQGLDEYRVGPWVLAAGKTEWTIWLKPSRNLSGAWWENVRVHLGGPGAMSATPPATFGEKGTMLRWRNGRIIELHSIVFRPPSPQQWNAIALSSSQLWEVLGGYSASGAFWCVAAGVLLLVCARRIRRSLGGGIEATEKKAIRALVLWAFLQTFLVLVGYLGDNIYRLLEQQFSWKNGYGATVELFSLIVFGVALCFFGRVEKGLLVLVCTLSLCVAALALTSELAELPLMPTSDIAITFPGTWVVVIVYLALSFVCCMGLISAGQRLLFMGDRMLPTWVTVSLSIVASVMTILWAHFALERDWQRTSWLADPEWSSYRENWQAEINWFWSWFPEDMLDTLLALLSVLTSVALVGVLRVCRVERHEEDAFTPNRAERFLFVVFFAVAVVPGDAYYFGFSGQILTFTLALFSAWGILVLGASRSVLEQPSANNTPLGKVISRTSPSDVLRLARRFRELQSHLQRLSAASQSDRSVVQESIEHEIDRLDQCLPEGVRPIDLPFAYGPMHLWWDNACRCALIACFIGLPATGLMYWTAMVQNETWATTTEIPSGFLWIVLQIAFWHTTWVAGGFFLGALWRDLPGRHGPTKAFCVAVAFAVPVAAHEIITQTIGQATPSAVRSIAAFASVLTFTGLAMDIQTFQSERRYWPTNMSLVAYVYQMRIASVAFFLAQILALATIWKTIREGGPTAPPPTR
ncbi:DUF6185 family protein [Streptomyces sp. NPDC032472]|uniref:DUF6185 family protein n=1 Tax=Streptomyces sp. NPDC032472 TaxID=3155018 RepID=UPI0033D3D197